MDLDQSLDEHINKRRNNRRNNSGGAVVGNNRRNRQVAPYQSGKKSNATKNFSNQQLTLKFLLTNEQAGTLIGVGGQCITDCKEISHAIIHVSNPRETYPGRHERILYITGSAEAVNNAQSLVWDMIASITSGAPEWSPRKRSILTHDAHVESMITIPSEAAGLILGRGGSTVRQISEESGAKFGLRSQDDAADATGERIATISGTLSQCLTCTSLVLAKFQEDLELCQYPTKGSSYSLQTVQSVHGGGGGGGREERISGGERERAHHGHSHGHIPHSGSRSFPSSSASLETISASTTFNVAVPDQLVGNIMGKQGSFLKEVMQLSGAEITVSGKGEYIEGTRNRLITITGEPSCAQTAYTLLKNKLSEV